MTEAYLASHPYHRPTLAGCRVGGMRRHILAADRNPDSHRYAGAGTHCCAY